MEDAWCVALSDIPTESSLPAYDGGRGVENNVSSTSFSSEEGEITIKE